jgi:transposase
LGEAQSPLGLQRRHGRWEAFVRFVDDGELPTGNNHIGKRIRPIALEPSSWLFAGSLRGGQRATAVTNLIQSAKLNGTIPAST